MYTPILGQSTVIDKLFFRLQKTISCEVHFSRQANELLGALDVLFETSTNPLLATESNLKQLTS